MECTCGLSGRESGSAGTWRSTIRSATTLQSTADLEPEVCCLTAWFTRSRGNFHVLTSMLVDCFLVFFFPHSLSSRHRLNLLFYWYFGVFVCTRGICFSTPQRQHAADTNTRNNEQPIKMIVFFYYQLDAQILYLNTFITFLYMFRALLCSSSRGQLYQYSIRYRHSL